MELEGYSIPYTLLVLEENILRERGWEGGREREREGEGRERGKEGEREGGEGKERERKGRRKNFKGMLNLKSGLFLAQLCTYAYLYCGYAHEGGK